MSYLYKLVLNAAYGRLGIHPESEVLEICTEARYKEFIMNDLGLKDAYQISDTCYLVKFVKNRNDCPDEGTSTLFSRPFICVNHSLCPYSNASSRCAQRFFLLRY